MYKITSKKINEMSLHERPREKFYQKGVNALDDVELLALALGKGSKKFGVMELAEKVLEAINKSSIDNCVESLEKIHGIGKVKAGSLISAFEFAKRRIKPSGLPVTSAQDVYNLVKHLSHEKQEHLICISLNGEHVTNAVRIVTTGILNATHVHPREIYSDPIVDRAASIIIAHNHPSGSLKPSDADINVTKKIKEAGEILGISLLDHVIFSKFGFKSLREQGQWD